MTPSQACYDLIKHYESCRLTAYLDSVGIPTIGYGHTAGVNMGDTCTQEQADQWLKEDVKHASDAINTHVKATLTQHQFDALVSLCYNIGEGNFDKSTLLKLLNSNQFDAAAEQFKRWDMAGGKHLAGLANRRAGEENLFDS